MNNLFSLIILVLSIIVSHSLIAQNNYESAYIIETNGDTIKGLIDYRNWNINPSKVNFKRSLSASPVSYSPLDIKEFSVLDEIYVSGIVETETSPFVTNQLTSNASLNIKNVTTFLQTIIKGSKNLYFYKNAHGNKNFFIKEDNNFELLVYKKYLSENENAKTYVAENNQYKRQLATFLADCPDIKSIIRTTKYTTASLKNLFVTYFDCKNIDVSFEKKQEKKNNSFGLFSGLTNSSVRFNSATFDELVKGDFDTDVTLNFGVFFDFILSRNLGKLSLNNELMYTYFNLEGYYENVIHENRYTNYTTVLDYSYIKMNNMFRYRFYLGKINWFGNIGMSNGIAIKHENYTTVVNKFFEDGSTTVEQVTSLRNYEQGLLLGLGGKFNKFIFEARIERGNGMFQSVSLGTETTRLYLLFAYAIK